MLWDSFKIGRKSLGGIKNRKSEFVEGKAVSLCRAIKVGYLGNEMKTCMRKIGWCQIVKSFESQT